MVLMFLYGPLDTDGRVLRCLSVFEKMQKNVTILTTRSKKNFTSQYVNHIIFDIHFGGIIEYCKFVKQCLNYNKEHENEVDAYYCHDYFTTLVGYLISRRSNKKIVYDAHELLLRKKSEKVSLRDKAFIYFERLFIRRAFYVIEANDERARIVKCVYKLKNVTSVLNITSKANANTFTEIKQYNSNKDYILVYQGTVGEYRNLSFFVKSLKFLPNNIKLLLIGRGDIEYYQSLAVDLGLENRVTLTGQVTNDEMLELLKKCHLGIITYPFTDLNNIYCSPNKIFEYAAMCLPMISTNQPFLDKCISHYNLGATFKENDYEDFCKKVHSILDTEYKPDYFNQFLSDFNFDKEAEKYEMVIRNL